MNVLNIPVRPETFQRWRGYLAPQSQPFFFTPQQLLALGWHGESRSAATITDEQRDTFRVWRLPSEASEVVQLSQDQWLDLPPRTRRQVLRWQVKHGRGNVPLGQHFSDLLPDLPRGRFLWSPEQLTPEVLARLISTGQEPCQRHRVSEEVWQAACAVLPRVHELAGRFSGGSTGNCFGAVMGAAGVAGAEEQWMQREPFEAFLAERSAPGGSDDQPGTLLVWRSPDGALQHAAVTLGSGWAFQKPSQLWHSPRHVLPTRALIAVNRSPGQRLQRRHLIF